MSDLFEQKHIAPMLLYQTKPFDDENYIFELKFDGIRCIAYLDPATRSVTLENKRFKDVSEIYPELAGMYKTVKKRAVLDGELVVLTDGKPDFFALQRRALMSDEFRIRIAMRKTHVQFVAYDILYFDGIDLTNLPLMSRKEMLEKNVKECENLGISRYIERNGIAFFQLAKVENLEGVVAKKKDGIYHIGKRTRDWLKIKVMQDDDFLICGYQPDADGAVKDLIMGTREKGKLVCRGKVYLGISEEERKIVEKFAAENPASPHFPQYKTAVWMQPKLVGTVEYMHKTEKGNMRQPVWKGLRTD